MKKDIHPKVNKDVTVTCACGNSFITTSVLDSITVDICSACHPFYTGEAKFVDTEGRIDKFKKKMELSKQKSAETRAKKEKITQEPAAPKTLKEMLESAN